MITNNESPCLDSNLHGNLKNLPFFWIFHNLGRLPLVPPPPPLTLGRFVLLPFPLAQFWFSLLSTVNIFLFIKSVVRLPSCYSIDSSNTRPPLFHPPANSPFYASSSINSGDRLSLNIFCYPFRSAAPSFKPLFLPDRPSYSFSSAHSTSTFRPLPASKRCRSTAQSSIFALLVQK
jgi:hypothetical protein